jgi:hypothetical protein
MKTGVRMTPRRVCKVPQRAEDEASRAEISNRTLNWRLLPAGNGATGYPANYHGAA